MFSQLLFIFYIKLLFFICIYTNFSIVDVFFIFCVIDFYYIKSFFLLPSLIIFYSFCFSDSNIYKSFYLSYFIDWIFWIDLMDLFLLRDWFFFGDYVFLNVLLIPNLYPFFDIIYSDLLFIIEIVDLFSSLFDFFNVLNLFISLSKLNLLWINY